MRQRGTLYSNASSREMPVQAPARPQWRNLCRDYERQLLLGAAVVLALLAAAPYFTGSLAGQTILQQTIDAAVIRPAADLRPGDAVVAVGFPFGIGPSVSAGVVSGLAREYRSPGGARTLSNLIQFDAAVNPGSSGGALLNAAGEVVGIVSAMLDPGGGGFACIGFAVPIETASAAAGTPPFGR